MTGEEAQALLQQASDHVSRAIPLMMEVAAKAPEYGKPYRAHRAAREFRKATEHINRAGEILSGEHDEE